MDNLDSLIQKLQESLLPKDLITYFASLNEAMSDVRLKVRINNFIKTLNILKENNIPVDNILDFINEIDSKEYNEYDEEKHLNHIKRLNKELKLKNKELKELKESIKDKVLVDLKTYEDERFRYSYYNSTSGNYSMVCELCETILEFEDKVLYGECICLTCDTSHYLLHGILNDRENGTPCILFKDGSFRRYKDGVLHNNKGYAMYDVDRGVGKFYVKGEEMTEEDFKKYILS